MTHQDPDVFGTFNALLTYERPDYVPWYFRLSADKDPDLSIGSWKVPTSRITEKQAFRHLKNGMNVGIAATGDDGLVIIDIDDIGVTPDRVVPKTLSATSRKRIGRHYFYFTDDIKAKRNIATDDSGEVRANWQYVVAPGSYVNTGAEEIAMMPEPEQQFAGRYTLLNLATPSMIKFEQFPPVFLEQIKKNEELEQIVEDRDARRAKERNEQSTHNSTFSSVMYDLTITDVVGKISNPRKRFPSLFHGSETGKNTTVSGGVLTCWRHNVTHTAMTALAVMAGIASCGVAGYGMRGSGGGKSGVDFTDGMIMFKMWKFAKESGMLPDDDPVPIHAFRAYAATVGIWDTGSGDTMTDVEYDQTVILIERREGIDSGRRRRSTLKL